MHIFFGEKLVQVLCSFFYINIFFNFVLHRVAAARASPAVVSGVCSPVSVLGLLTVDPRLERPGCNSCDRWALLRCGMWNLPEPGVDPVFPPLAAGFLTTGPPEKSLFAHFLCWVICKKTCLFIGSKNSSCGLDVSDDAGDLLCCVRCPASHMPRDLLLETGCFG